MRRNFIKNTEENIYNFNFTGQFVEENNKYFKWGAYILGLFSIFAFTKPASTGEYTDLIFPFMLLSLSIYCFCKHKKLLKKEDEKRRDIERENIKIRNLILDIEEKIDKLDIENEIGNFKVSKFIVENIENNLKKIDPIYILKFIDTRKLYKNLFRYYYGINDYQKALLYTVTNLEIKNDTKEIKIGIANIIKKVEDFPMTYSEFYDFLNNTNINEIETYIDNYFERKNKIKS